jgi:hypothetical protein
LSDLGFQPVISGGGVRLLTVPEPSGVAVLLIGAMGLIGRRRGCGV